MSGATKWMWFLRPDGWTLYDNLAAKGLGIHHADTVTRGVRYYERLDELGFPVYAREISTALQQHPVHGLFGERTIDKFLMLVGNDQKDRKYKIESCKAYLRSFPNPLRNQIKQSAERIGRQFGPLLLN